MPVDPQYLAAVLSAIASSGKIIESSLALLDKGLTIIDFKSLKKKAEEETRESIKGDTEAINQLASMIPSNILDAVSSSIEAIHQNIADILIHKGYDKDEKEKRIRSDRNSICWYIAQVSSFGKIPDVLLTQWKTLKCADYSFKLENE